MNLIILGAPGSGKDTLAKKITSQFNHYQIITTGELYRKEAELGTEFGLKAKEYWEKGNLCPDEMTNDLMSNTIANLQNKENIIFNGYPRTIGQSEFLDTITTITLAIHLQVDEKEIIRRLMLRKREDDVENIVKHRLVEFNIKTSPLIDYYSRSNRIHSIDNTNLDEQETYQKALEIMLNQGERK